ncbi:hypothetical protein [Taibaiella koreensis]|uniref:hypothetical protein n=1 Tax=Taibaiella koreensis TaxID=1268548 RepID=UPI000E59F242|nr:hypothetical protein [Taibaiella koreensis]
MKKTSMKLAILLMLCHLVHQINAQEGGKPDQAMIPGATATSYGIGTAYSTNYFDGTVNISVPFYSFVKDQMNFGVSMNYNTRGIPVDEISSIAGLHWVLNTGPSIQRIVKDIPDEINYTFRVYPGFHPDSLYPGSTEIGIYNPHKYVKGKLAVYGETTAETARTNVYRDGECDDFILSIGGQSVTFNLGKDGKIFTHPHQNIKIQPMLGTTAISKITTQVSGVDDAPNTLEFKVTDEVGNQYFFIVGEFQGKRYFDNTYWDGDYDELVNAKQIDQWVIKRILFADGSEITYNYGEYQSSLFKLYRNYSAAEISAGASYLGLEDEMYQGTYYPLTDIVYPNNESVNFYYHATNKNEAQHAMLREISHNSGPNCIIYRFVHSTFNKRFQLDRLDKLGCGMTDGKTYYSFGYNTEYTLPDRLNGGKDLFGYYNGDSIAAPLEASGNKITIPAHNWETGLPNYGLSRFPVHWRAQASLLKKITNEYGGTATFYYGDNEAVKVLTGLPTAENYRGTDDRYAVRVDSIVEADYYEKPNHLKRIRISYADGKLFTPGGYFHYPTYFTTGTATTPQKVVYQSMFLTPHDLINGSNHGYSTVNVREYNGANELLSRREMLFTNISDPTTSTPRYYRVSGSKQFYEYPYTQKQYIKDWEIGLPREITSYDNNDKIVSKVINTYTFSAVDLSASSYVSNTKRVKVSAGTSVIPPIAMGMPPYYPNKKIFTDVYTPYTGIANLTRTVTLKYASDTRFITDTVWIAYDERNNPKTSVAKNSEGEKRTTKLIYNYDVDGPGSTHVSTFPGTAIYKMTENNLEELVSVEYWDEDNTGTKPYSNTLVNASITGFQYSGTKLFRKSENDLLTDLPITYTDYTGLSASGPAAHPYKKIIDINNTTAAVPFVQRTNTTTLFDDKGNALETQFLGQNKYQSAVWDLTSGDKLAEANCRYQDIAYSSFEDFYGANTAYTNRGNWDMNSGKVLDISSSSTLNSVTGRYIYQMTPPPTGGSLDHSYILGVNNLAAGKEYLLSLWARGGVPKVYIGTTLLTTPAVAYTKGLWKQYIYRFTPSAAGKVRLDPITTTIYLDEVRLHPAEAVMESSTYEPLFGAGSKTDVSGRVVYFEYDKLGNLVVERDQEGKIVRKTKYYKIGGELY